MMKFNFKLLLQIFLIAQILVTPLMASKVLFVQNFENNTNDDKYKSTGNALADMIASVLVGLKVDGLKVVERAKINKVIDELKFQQSEYFDKTTTQKMGKGLAANFTLAGSFVVIGKEVRIDARLIDVTTAEIQSAFTVKGQEDQFMALAEDLMIKIGKGLALEIKTVNQDNLSGPATLGTLVKYGDIRVDLMDKGDYKTASAQLAELRKADPKFKLSESAYKEAMKKLYESKGKRENILSEAESKLLESALQNSKTDNPKAGLAYQWVLMEMYFRQMKKIVGVDPNLSGGTESLGQGWVRESNSKGMKARMTKIAVKKLPEIPENATADEDNPILAMVRELEMAGKLPGIPENEMTKFKDYLDLYVQAYVAVITHSSKLDRMALMGVDQAFSPTDEKLIEDLGWEPPGIFPSVAVMNDDLATFLLLETDFTPAPYKIDEKFGSLGLDLLEKATKEAAKPGNPYNVRDASRQMDRHGDILLIHDRGADAIAKWQEILDKYPTYEEFNKIEEKIKKALE